MKTPEDEKKFMQENIEQIIDPEPEVKAYLKMRKAVQVFTIFCILQQVIMLVMNQLNYGNTFTMAASAGASAAYGSSEAMKYSYYSNIVLNLASNIYGIRALSYHSFSMHVYFQLFMMLSLISESIFSSFMVANVFMLVPKFSLFIFDIFLSFKFMPQALKINVGKAAEKNPEEEKEESTEEET